MAKPERFADGWLLAPGSGEARRQSQVPERFTGFAKPGAFGKAKELLTS
jgi:hypothetical protein